MNKLTVNKLEKIADRFCESMKTKYPDIWWCFGNSDEFRILFYICKWSESENAKPIWKLNSEGIVPDAASIANGSAVVLVIAVIIFNLLARILGKKLFKVYNK